MEAKKTCGTEDLAVEQLDGRTPLSVLKAGDFNMLLEAARQEMGSS